MIRIRPTQGMDPMDMDRASLGSSTPHQSTTHTVTPDTSASPDDPPPASHSIVSVPTYRFVNCFAGSLSLGPFDYIIPRLEPISAVYFYPSTAITPQPIPSDTLFTALQHVVAYYPHLTGRAGRSPTRPVGVEPTPTGALFEDCECYCPLDEFCRPDQPLLIASFPHQGREFLSAVAACQGQGAPLYIQDVLLGIRHTRFLCGSVALGISIMSAVADSRGFFTFVKDLCEMYRLVSAGQPAVLPRPCYYTRPVLDRLGIDMSPAERYWWQNYEPTSYELGPSSYDTDHDPAKPPPRRPSSPVVSQFKGDVLQRMVDECAEQGYPGLSPFDVLAALVCRVSVQSLIAIAIETNACRELCDIPVHAAVVVDWRERLQLPQDYPFNATTQVMAEWDSAYAMGWDAPGKVAQKLQRSKKRESDDSRVESLIRWAAAHAGSTYLKSSEDVRRPLCTIVGWHEYDMYASSILDDIRPSLIAPPWDGRFDFPGLAYIVEGPRGKGDLELYLYLTEEEWRNLSCDWASGQLSSEFLRKVVQ